MAEEKSLDEELNYESLSGSNKMYQKSVRGGLKALIKCLPREVVIDILKELKYIERDWIPKKRTYVERKDAS